MEEKQKATQQRLIKEGRFTGGKKLFGYDLDKNNYYIPCEKKQEVIRKVQLKSKQEKNLVFLYCRKVTDQQQQC